MAERIAESREAKGEALARAQMQGGRDALFGRDGQGDSEAHGGGNQPQGRAPCRGGSVMNDDYIPCKRRDPTAWEAIRRVRREERKCRTELQRGKIIMRQATERMMEYAEAIAEYFNIDMPASKDFNEIHNFISKYADKYRLQLELEGVVLESRHDDWGDRR